MLSTKKFMLEILNLAKKVGEAKNDDGNPTEIEEQRLFYWITFIFGYNFLIIEDENPGTIKILIKDHFITPQMFLSSSKDHFITPQIFLSSSTEVFLFHHLKKNDDILKVIKKVHHTINSLGKLESDRFRFESKLDENFREWNISFTIC